MDSVIRHCFVMNPKDFFEANDEGDDVFYCEYEYDVHWHSFKRISEIDNSEEVSFLNKLLTDTSCRKERILSNIKAKIHVFGLLHLSVMKEQEMMMSGNYQRIQILRQMKTQKKKRIQHRAHHIGNIKPINCQQYAFSAIYSCLTSLFP